MHAEETLKFLLRLMTPEQRGEAIHLLEDWNINCSKVIHETSVINTYDDDGQKKILDTLRDILEGRAKAEAFFKERKQARKNAKLWLEGERFVR